ncbi:MAG: hypothetical protein SNG45_03025 [Rikenellaceae bacterium]
MPRKRTKTIAISRLKCYDQIVAELQANEWLQGYEIEKSEIVIKEYVAPVIRPENLQKAIKAIERYLHFDKDKGEFYDIVSMNQISTITKISRPTITRWCRDGLIKSGSPRFYFGEDAAVYDLNEILGQLKAIKIEQK